ncbi:MAG: beta-galactosidase [Bacteroidales bacterium]|nr:beta-galactosidase [Bacteroidales bacterium]
MDPPENYHGNSVDFQKWADIQIPGECQMQGFAIKHDQPYVYRHKFFVPADYEGKHILLNFYGVYSYARVWVNGHYIRDHHGGFTKWSCDITDHVEPGKEAVLALEFTDRTDDISYGSGYAKHQIGGILRDVELTALPKQHFSKLFYETHLDEDYLDAELKVMYELSQPEPATITIDIFDNAGKLITTFSKDAGEVSGTLTARVENPKKWDAEHPNLYRVVVTLSEDGKVTMKTARNIGFRVVEIDGNKLLVNGNQVKLRGANRHDIHPLLGRMTTPEYDKLDVLLAKEANMNFIRTSHYPPSETFLEYCDQYGIYVEDETAVCFVGSHRTAAYKATGTTQNEPEFTERYLLQLEEMVQNHRNHPSVIIWSIGNENVFGSNFVKSFNWVKGNDPTRPVIFSYPGHVPDSLKIYEILSMHYPDWRGDLNQYGKATKGFSYGKMPVLFDEWAHVATYNNYELKYDPNVRNFWGQSLDSMWTYVFMADGGLGGAIWCMIDETFMLPEDLPGLNDWWGIIDPKVSPPTYTGPCIGYGEWGILDTWRRKKPEFWLTKKAYSPIKINVKQIEDFLPDTKLNIPVHNRFDHTDFSELKITWKYDGRSGELKNVYLKPHENGEIVIPPNKWNTENELNIRFYQNDTLLVDEYNIRLGERKVTLPACQKGNLRINETNDQIYLSGKNFVLDVNKKTGLLENVCINEKVLIKSGPYINLKLPGKHVAYSSIEMQDYAKNWRCREFAFNVKDGIATINTKGICDSISASFTIQIDENGVFVIDYEIDDVPEGRNIQEAGIKFIAGESFDKLTWDRNSYFTAYPQLHLGIPTGEIDLNVNPIMNYRKNPQHEWEMDTKGFYYFGPHEKLPYSNIARSLKENIYFYSLKSGSNEIIKIFSDGTQACRFDKVDGINTLIINNEWDYTSLLWGNYMKRIKSGKVLNGKAILKVVVK